VHPNKHLGDGERLRCENEPRLHLGPSCPRSALIPHGGVIPGYLDANFNIEHLVPFAQTLECGCFDACFIADHLAVLNMPMDALKRSATAS
jgi:hypothetical protein